MNWLKEKILITGGTGLIGKSLSKHMKKENLEFFSIGNSKSDKKHSYDLRNPSEVKKVFNYYNPKVIFHLAAKVGGIYANNSMKSEFYVDNTFINTNIISEVNKRNIPFVFAMGTGCAYPKRLENSLLSEKDFLDGIPEVTNDAYAYSKRNLLVHLRASAEDMGLNYIYCIPANIYGPYDNFHELYSHVVPGLIVRLLIAKEKNYDSIKIWGTGKAKRDFLYVDDLIDAMFLISRSFKNNDSINIASGQLTSIELLANIIKETIGYEGIIENDTGYPEGQKLRIFDINKIKKMNWKATTSLMDGISKTVKWCKKNPNWWKNQNIV